MAKSSAKSDSNGLVTPNKRATSYDVARLAGVSQSAVSRCFKAGASVSAKTRAKVEKAAQKLGYQPNAIARGLISGRSNIVAVIITDQTNLVYPEVLSLLNQAFAARDVHILLFTLTSEGDVDRVVDQVWQYQVDGIVAAAQLSDAHIRACEDRDIPVVFYNRAYSQSNISSVCCDHAEGERVLVEQLVKDGRKRFLVMSGPTDSWVSTVRTHGALQTLKKAKVEVREVAGDYSYDHACELLDDTISDGYMPDAIVCANDTMAFGCIDTLRKDHGKSVPAEVAVVGFDGVSAAFWKSYDLTTVVQPVKRMVSATVSLLMEHIDDRELPAEKRFFAGELHRGSSGFLNES